MNKLMMEWHNLHWAVRGTVYLLSGFVIAEAIRIGRGVFREICNAAHIDRIERGERD